MKKCLSILLTFAILSLMALPACAEIRSFRRGDVNLDTELSVIDVAIIRASIVKNITLNAEKQKLADVNADNDINIVDVAVLRADIVRIYRIEDTIDIDVDAANQEELTEKSFFTTEQYVKTQGRTYYYDDCTWLIQSASAVEFSFVGTKGSVVVHGDQNCFESWAENSLARIGIFVNGEMVVDELVDNYEKEYTFLDTDAETKAEVKIVKLSDPAQSVVGINKINVTSKGNITPLEEKSLKIEFIGDSITCGIGVDDPHVDGVYCTASCNASKTFAYKVASMFDADYSFFAYSGFGCLSGYRGTDTIDSKNTIPPIYPTYGMSSGKIAGELKPSDIEYDFSSWQPDLVVINLGTNDNNYTKSNQDRKAEFSQAYYEFIKTVKSKYPNAKVLCVLGLGGANLYTPIKNAAEKYNAETGTEDVNYLKLSPIQEGDGVGVQNHPLEVSHARAAGEIRDKLVSWLSWEVK